VKAPDEYGINKDFTEKSTDWIATDGKRCTDVPTITTPNMKQIHSLARGLLVARPQVGGE